MTSLILSSRVAGTPWSHTYRCFIRRTGQWNRTGTQLLSLSVLVADEENAPIWYCLLYPMPIPWLTNAPLQANTKIPVLGHADGICHVYVDAAADIDKALKIVVDAKACGSSQSHPCATSSSSSSGSSTPTLSPSYAINTLSQQLLHGWLPAGPCLPHSAPHSLARGALWWARHVCSIWHVMPPPPHTHLHPPSFSPHPPPLCPG